MCVRRQIQEGEKERRKHILVGNNKRNQTVHKVKIAFLSLFIEMTSPWTIYFLIVTVVAECVFEYNNDVQMQFNGD